MVKAKRKVLAICFTASAMLSAAGGVVGKFRTVEDAK